MSKLIAISTVTLAAVLLAGCGGGHAAAPQTTTTNSSGGSNEPGTSFSVATVSGVGKVVVDGNGRTVYILTNAARQNLPCTDDSGCTGVWPDLSLPFGASAPTAGEGLDASLLGTMKANGEEYPTYNDYLLYEYSGDTKAGQANGVGIKSFGGTWYALSPSGMPVKASGMGGYGY